MVKIHGMKSHKARLRRIKGGAMVREVGKAIFASADYLTTEAALSITAGAVSGAGHVPSLPGFPPNEDTGTLSRSIRTERTGPLKAESSANAPYAAALEFGTSKMAERPYMRPAAQKTRKQAQGLVSAAVKRVVKGGAL